MSTPRDLVMTVLAASSERPVEQGEMSLVLAAAELIDLLAAGVVALDGDRIVPGESAAPAPADRLLEQAAVSLERHEPYESVEEWLWWRGRDLAAAYLTALADDGQLIRQRHGRVPFQTGDVVAADSPDRRQAEERWRSGEPVLVELAKALGVRDEQAAQARQASWAATGEAVDTVLAAVNDAVLELEGIRQRRAIEEAAFDNIWRSV